MKTAVIGSGGWGTALSMVLEKNGHEVTLWSHNPAQTETLRSTRENPRLAGVKLPEGIEFTSDPACAGGKDLIVASAPSFALRNTMRLAAPYITPGTVVVSVAKGIEPGTCLRMSEIVAQETGAKVVALSGPTHAEEVSRYLPTGCVAACPDRELAEFVQDAFMNEVFRVYTSADVVGIELGGALKNIIALCAGISDGLGFEDNTKALLMTRGLSEIAKLGRRFGASKDTFAGLSGVGDLIVTCTSMHSRNRRAGILIGQGATAQEAMDKVGAVVEGYYAAESAMQLGKKAGIELPIVSAAYDVLYNGGDPRLVSQALMTREKRHELENPGWEN
jgi:glycerol-3-phosphate dehydrogenase (NAD(P)+)